MLGKKVEQALNKQINAELFSAYLYLSMESYFKSINLNGFANWMRVQALEEMSHADIFFRYVYDRSGRVIADAIKKPDSQWDSALAVFEHVGKHEAHVTSLINDLVKLSREENDNATYNMLQWFVKEQVEEEANAEQLVQQLKLIQGNGMGILMLDRELATRVFTPPIVA